MTRTNEELETLLKEKRTEIGKLVSGVQGWVNDDAGVGLYQIARFATSSTIVVELGSWRGRSTIWLGRAISDRLNEFQSASQGIPGTHMVYAVDTWEGTPDEKIHAAMLKDYKPDQLYDEFLGNMEQAGILNFITPIRKTTAKAARDWPIDAKIGLLFIDAGHSYEDVRRDFEMWSPYVETGGFIVFDDVPSWAGPTRLVSELPTWCRFVRTHPNQWVCKKV